MKTILKYASGSKALIDTTVDTLLWSRTTGTMVERYYAHTGAHDGLTYYYNTVIIDGIINSTNPMEQESMIAFAESEYENIAPAARARLVAAGALKADSEYE